MKDDTVVEDLRKNELCTDDEELQCQGKDGNDITVFKESEFIKKLQLHAVHPIECVFLPYVQLSYVLN